MDPITALAALGPVAVEFGKAAIARWIAPDAFRPATVDEWLSMRKADTDLFKAVSDAGGSEPTYQWVGAIKQLMRPGVAGIVLLVWAAAHLQSQVDTSSIDNFASAIGFYLFGDRTLFYAKRGR